MLLLAETETKMNILHMLTEFQHLCFAESRAIDTEKEEAQRAQELFANSADSPAFKAALRIRTAIQDARMSCAKEIVDAFKSLQERSNL